MLCALVSLARNGPPGTLQMTNLPSYSLSSYVFCFLYNTCPNLEIYYLFTYTFAYYLSQYKIGFIKGEDVYPAKYHLQTLPSYMAFLGLSFIACRIETSIEA